MGGKDQLYEVRDQLLLYDPASTYFEPGTPYEGGRGGQHSEPGTLFLLPV